MKRLQNFSIQSKLIGIFGAVFFVGVLAVGWNTLTIYRNKEQVDTMLDRADEMLYLQVIEIQFRNLESIEKDYVLGADPYDEDELIPMYEEELAYLQGYLDEVRQGATSDEIVQLVDQLEVEQQAQAEFFEELIALVEAEEVDAAQEASWIDSDRKYENIYNVLAENVDTRWGTLFETLDTTQQRMDTAIRVSVGTVALFMLIGTVIGLGMRQVSRQIVRPMMTMSNVAESIEKEEFKTDPLSPLTERQDEIGQLARVFARMAREIYARVETLRKQVAELQIVIDRDKMARQVSEITDTEYFQDLQSKVKTLRNRDKPKDTSTG